MFETTTRRPCALAVHEWFYVGGRYVERRNGAAVDTFMVGQMYVEHFVPPFRMVRELDAPEWVQYAAELERPWGITRTPMQFDPPVEDAAELAPALGPPPADPELIAGYLPGCAPRRLPNLAGVPILIVVSHSSYHAVCDHCTSAFLTWAGVNHEFVRLPDRGFTGNGHMVMLEKNSHEIADLLVQWLADQDHP